MHKDALCQAAFGIIQYECVGGTHTQSAQLLEHCDRRRQARCRVGGRVEVGEPQQLRAGHATCLELGRGLVDLVGDAAVQEAHSTRGAALAAAANSARADTVQPSQHGGGNARRRER
jgi:hypothetical protein